MSNIAKNLKNARPRSMSQEDAARLANIGVTSLSNYETGKTDIPLSIAQKLCKIYGVSESVLFED